MRKKEKFFCQSASGSKASEKTNVTYVVWNNTFDEAVSTLEEMPDLGMIMVASCWDRYVVSPPDELSLTPLAESILAQISFVQWVSYFGKGHFVNIKKSCQMVDEVLGLAPGTARNMCFDLKKAGYDVYMIECTGRSDKENGANKPEAGAFDRV